MLIEKLYRRLITCRNYQRKDGTDGVEVQLFDPYDHSVVSLYVTPSFADQTMLSYSSFGDLFSVDLEVSTTKFGTRLNLVEARKICASNGAEEFINPEKGSSSDAGLDLKKGGKK